MQDYLRPKKEKFSKEEEMIKILKLMLGVAISCENKEYFISEIMNKLDEETKANLIQIIEPIQ